MKRLTWFFTSLVALLFVASPLPAHHGVDRYDLSKTIMLDGTITGFDWTNPHCLIHMDAKNEQGLVQHWTLELAAPLTMSRKGWTKDSLRPGDQAEVETHPARNGVPIGLSATTEYIKTVIVNGKKISQ